MVKKLTSLLALKFSVFFIVVVFMASVSAAEETACNANAKLKINFLNVSNIGNGDLSNKVFVGVNATEYADGQLIPLSENGLFITDANYVENVSGISLQRLPGQVRFLLFGGHDPRSREILAAKVEFENAVITGFKNDLSNAATPPYSLNILEKQNDLNYSLGDPSQDEVFPGIGSNTALWYSTVSIYNDGFFLNYSCGNFTVSKFWSDTATERNPLDKFDVILQKNGNVISTNPGGFFINIAVQRDITNATSIVITDKILNNILSNGDFRRGPLGGGMPVHVYINGNNQNGIDVTNKFSWTFNGKTLVIKLKSGEQITANSLYADLHLKYAWIGKNMNESVQELFPRTYTNTVNVRIGNLAGTSSANLTAFLKSE